MEGDAGDDARRRLAAAGGDADARRARPLNGDRPSTPRRPPRRRLRILGGLIAAFLVLGVLVSPVILRGHGSSCSLTLRYAGRTYKAREVGDANVVQSIAVGTGVLSGCGSKPQNADVRSIVGIPPAFAVGLPTEASTLFVQRDRCPDLTGRGLVRCLRE